VTRPRRTYAEGCIAAHALDLIGDRWALLVVRELLLGPRRFGAIRAGLPGISANVLTQRLADLEAAGLLIRETLPDPAQVQIYRLTPAGQGLWPVLRALCLWGAQQAGHDPALFISPAALMLSMRATANRAAAGHHRAEFRLGEDSFAIDTAPGRYRVTPGPAPDAALRFAGPANAMAAAVYGRRPLQETAQGPITFTGDPAQGQRFLDLFALPRPLHLDQNTPGSGAEPRA